MDDDDESLRFPLLDVTAVSLGLYQLDHRPTRDIFWRFSYLICIIVTALGGLYAALSPDTTLALMLDVDYLDDPLHCPHPGLFYVKDTDGDRPFLPPGFIMAVSGLIVVCVSVTMIMAILFIIILQHHAGAMLVASLSFQVIMPLAVGVIAMQNDKPTVAYICFLSATALALCYLLAADSLHVVGRLLSISASALRSIPGLILSVALLKLVMLSLSILILLAVLLASANGQAVINPLRGHSPAHQCVSTKGDPVTCCIWEASAWTASYMRIALATLSWTILLGFQVKVFTVSGVIAQWYFSPIGSAPSGSISRTLGHALGPSLGSLSLGAMVMVALSSLRLLLDRFRRQRDQEGVLVATWGCCVSCILQLFQYLTKFSTVYMAIAGTSFLKSGYLVVELLRRNALDAYSVWWLPPLVLNLTAFFLSVSTGIATYVFLYDPLDLTPFDFFGTIEVNIISVASAGLSWLVLHFLTSILLNVIDAVFICFAYDRECCMCSQSQVHEIFNLIPGCGSQPEASLDHDASLFYDRGVVGDPYFFPSLLPSGRTRGLDSLDGSGPSSAGGGGATGVNLEYWQAVQHQQYNRTPPGPSPLFYSPSFNADQARLAHEVSKGLQDES